MHQDVLYDFTADLIIIIIIIIIRFVKRQNVKRLPWRYKTSVATDQYANQVVLDIQK